MLAWYMKCCLQLRVIFVVSFLANRFNALDLETSIYMQLNCRPKLFSSVIFCSEVCQSKFTKGKALQQNVLKRITFYVNQLECKELLFVKLLLENNILLIVIGYLRCMIQKRGQAHTLLSPQTRHIGFFILYTILGEIPCFACQRRPPSSHSSPF